MLEIGDSIGNDLGWGLARELRHTKNLRLIQIDTSSTGLSASWFFNWPHHLKVDLARFHPNLVIVCLGANDEQALAVNHVSHAFGSAQWAAVYRHRVRQMMQLVAGAKSYLLWVGLPIMQPDHYNSGVNLLNSIYSRSAQSVAGAVFQPTTHLLADAHGKYRAGARVNGVESALRAPDGIHFTVVGENVLATFVVHQISTIFHVTLAARAPMRIDG